MRNSRRAEDEGLVADRRLGPLRFLLALAFLGLVIAAWAPARASAAYPGENGKIAFSSNRDGDFDVYAMNAPDLPPPSPPPPPPPPTNLTNNAAGDFESAWSPDGNRIAFESDLDSGTNEIYTMNASGSALARLTNNSYADGRPTWSPDAQKLAFESVLGGADIWVMNADGSGQTNLANDPSIAGWPAWSPDGTKIAFTSARDGNYEIYVMNANGSGQTRLTNSTGSDAYADWSPDGKKIAFTSDRDGNFQVYVMNANGSGQTNLTNNAADDYDPAWSPDGQRIAFGSFRDGNSEIYVMDAAPGSAQTNLTNNAALDGHPDWQPLKPAPIVFVHGFAGSKIACGSDQLYPDVPIAFPDMRLEADGETNLQQGTCNPLARPTEIFDSFVGKDVYGPTVDFLDRIAPGQNYIYVWDWRKSPQLALDELDLMVERARCDGTLPSGAITCQNPVHQKVVLMGHSMGGLVIRDYINDQPRADKVARALTIGTPYWGSPKAIFPLAAGLESPAADELDRIIVDEEFQEWARNAQGLYFLYPSANFGGWLTVAGRQPRPLDRAGLLSYVSDLGGTPALLERALDSHAQDLDGFKRNGVDFQAFVGAGLATVERVLFFNVAGQDYVKLTYAPGDGTVPVRSGTQGPQGTPDPLGEDIPIHYSCGVKHVPLPGDPAITPRIEDFLLTGAPVAPGPTSCGSIGIQVEIFDVDVNAPRAATASSASPSEPMVGAAGASRAPMTLEDAEFSGLIELIDLGAQKIIVTDSRTPVELSYSSAEFELNATPLLDGIAGQTSYYGPLSGEVTISAGSAFSLTDENGPVAPSPEGAPTVSVADASTPEGSDATVGLTLSRAVAFPVAVDFKTEDASATAGSDYSTREGSVVFEPGLQSIELSFVTNADTSAEGDEAFRVRLSNPVNAAIADAEGVVTILDRSPPGDAAAPGDTTAPQTTLDRTPKNKIVKSKATYEFSADEQGSSFECKLDRKQFKSCVSPTKLKRLKPGKHTFKVRAIDAAGNVDPEPAADSFRVRRRR